MRFWQLILTRGILFVIFGILALVWPKATLESLIILFAVFLLIHGIISLIHGLHSLFHEGYTGLIEMILGLLALVLGVFILKNPAFSALTYIYIFGIWLMLLGFSYICNPYSANSRYLSAIAGAILVLVGIAYLAKPMVSSVALVWVTGLFALIFGALLISLSLTLKSEIESLPETPSRTRK